MTDTVQFAVNGTLMRGLELNDNLLQVGAVFVEEATTAPCYRLWSIEDRHPGMIRTSDADGGTNVELEVWAVPPSGLAVVLGQEPAGLAVGKVLLADGREVLGVLAEPHLVENQPEITEFGGWRAYTANTALSTKEK